MLKNSISFSNEIKPNWQSNSKQKIIIINFQTKFYTYISNNITLFKFLIKNFLKFIQVCSFYFALGILFISFFLNYKICLLNIKKSRKSENRCIDSWKAVQRGWEISIGYHWDITSPSVSGGTLSHPWEVNEQSTEQRQAMIKPDGPNEEKHRQVVVN